MTHYALVGDVGGTNTRLALCDMTTGSLSQLATYSVRQFPSLETLIRDYLGDQAVTVEAACLAIACPITGDWVAMTNHSWEFSIAQMKAGLGLQHLEVINDFTAVSMAVPVLEKTSLIQIGGGEPVANQPVAVYGAGTGLGVAHLLRVDNRWISLPGEGGHVDFAAGSDEEDRVLQVLRRQWGHVSAERLLSGQGLVNLYRALVLADGREPQNLLPRAVSERALAAEYDVDCHRALSLFCSMMGRFGGNLALTLGTFGGVYIAGGIVPRFLSFFQASGFRAAFEDKGRFKDYLADIPVFLITHQQPGLLGAGAHLRQTFGSVL
ncbi:MULTISPECIES: glucokinase [unclassified Brenneria]|uniref:glucokinase n=1 Tax=unclassified Brenneria TaxID=2634434 RepID=UPI001551AD05|nr:glucokinase [Brenneria sp. hezel4-2-4]MEE3650947.1 glucokinase [Brenneria sp. HEZEL_4_2_4]NPD00903.1 glucokinase [Brenneria sp. hezel4-2-4]